jgi:hypothetical protein
MRQKSAEPVSNDAFDSQNFFGFDLWDKNAHGIGMDATTPSSIPPEENLASSPPLPSPGGSIATPASDKEDIQTLDVDSHENTPPLVWPKISVPNPLRLVRDNVGTIYPGMSRPPSSSNSSHMPFLDQSPAIFPPGQKKTRTVKDPVETNQVRNRAFVVEEFVSLDDPDVRMAAEALGLLKTLGDAEGNNVGSQPGLVSPYEVEKHEEPELAPEQNRVPGIHGLDEPRRPSLPRTPSAVEVEGPEGNKVSIFQDNGDGSLNLLGSQFSSGIASPDVSDSDSEGKKVSIFQDSDRCPLCNSTWRRDNVLRHMMRMHKKPRPKFSSDISGPDVSDSASASSIDLAMNRFLKLDEPSSLDGEVLVREALARELPFFEDMSMEVDSGPEVTVSESSFDKNLGRKIEEHIGRRRPETTELTFSHPTGIVSCANILGVRTQLNPSTHLADSTDDSETSDLESIMSEAPSIASSKSSVTLSIELGAIHELKTLFLTNESLGPLYEIAMSKVEPDKFQRNFKRLLVRYGRALSTEATAKPQYEAAKFICYAALRVSMHIKDAVADKCVKHPQKEKLSAKALGDYLKNIQDIDDDSGDEDYDEANHDPEEPPIQALDKVRNFMVSSKAFRDLCQSLRVWLGVETAHEQSDMADIAVHEAEAQASSPVDISVGISDQQSARPQERIPGITVSENTPTAFLERMGEMVGQKESESRFEPAIPILIGETSLGADLRVDTASSFSAVKIASKRFWCTLSGLWQPRLPTDQAQISWTCVSSCRASDPDISYQQLTSFLHRDVATLYTFKSLKLSKWLQ